jgi:omega-hydroxy-beta-dihydromenaquinone-9 sulfotransferase
LPVTKPIFVFGTGRSGSTIFFDVLARHPQVAWLSQLSRQFPRQYWLNRALLRARSVRWIDSFLDRRLGPSEAYPFWELLSRGFANPFRDLSASDVTQSAAQQIRRSIQSNTTSARRRFLAKITGWPRIGFLNQVFPDAQFVEIRRDPRATAASLLQVDFWDGWRGPSSWRRGPLPPDLEQIWLDEKLSFVALAALECVLIQRATAYSVQTLDAARYCTVLYSDLCSQPLAVYRRVASFCGLDWVSRFETTVRRFRFVNRDDQWRSTLTGEQQAILERTLERAGYPTP